MQLTSKIDGSVNFVTPCKDGGFFESRFVSREEDQLICYLSSHSGCALACKMCHLTATGQTMMTPSTTGDFAKQAHPVLQHAKQYLPKVRRVTFSFMARGEALANPTILHDSHMAFTELAYYARFVLGDVLVNFSVSTIMPNRVDLLKVFPVIHPRIYFSAYSSDAEVRASLVPNGIPFEEAAAVIRDYARVTGKICFIHGAFIKGVNDDLADAADMAKAFYGSTVGANIVQYNPPDGNTEEASSETLFQIENLYKTHLKGPVNAVPRVGFDVNASCGMFITKETKEDV